jgi:threonine/homoserine/homoserine lactone efflux protein
MVGTLIAFVAVSAVVICTPGQDTALTIRNTLGGGRRSGIATAAGVSLGQGVWTLAASAGLVALLSTSEPAYRALKLAGAAYLVYLGAQSLYAAARRREHGPSMRANSIAPARALRQACSATSVTRRWPSSSPACCRSSAIRSSHFSRSGCSSAR